MSCERSVCGLRKQTASVQIPVFLLASLGKYFGFFKEYNSLIFILYKIFFSIEWE